MKKKLFCSLIFGVLSITLVTSCSNNSSNSHPMNILRVDVDSEPPSLDPNISEDMNTTRIMTDLFAMLVDFDQQGNIIPGLAEKWYISPDGKTYTFYLRPNLKFSDGSPITAQDFVFSWRRLANPKTASSYNFLLSNVVNGQQIIDGKMPASSLGVLAPNTTTFVVNLVKPDSSFLNKNTLPNLAVLSQKNIEKYGSKWTTPEHMVTSGAYKLKEHVMNGYILAEKNPNFYDANNVKIDQVKYLPLVDTNAAMSSYAAGGLDVTGQNVPIDQYVELKSKYKDELHIVRQEALSYYEFNMKLPEFANNIPLRKALSMAIDREILSKDVLNGLKDPVYLAVTPTVANGAFAKLKYDWSDWSRDKRIAEAKKLYAEAGYSVSHPLHVTIVYNTNDMYKKITLALASMWKDNLGVDVTVENQEWKQFLQTRHKAGYQVARGGWFADYNAFSTYAVLYTCNSPQNDSKWCDPQFDKLVSLGNAEQDITKQNALYSQALQILQDSYSVIPLFQFSYTRLVKPYVKGYKMDHNYLDRAQTRWMTLAK